MMNKDKLLALADRLMEEDGRLDFDDFAFHWFNHANPIEMAECIKVHRTDRAMVAASIRKMAAAA